MTTTTLVLFGNSEYNRPQVNGVELYCALSERHVYESKTTQYPVQSGSTIIDNVVQSPTVVTMQVLVSDTPITPVLPTARGAQDLTATNERTIDGSLSINTMNDLIRIQDAREPVTLVTGIKVYKNMVLTKMDVPRDNKTGRALIFELEFSEIMNANVAIAQGEIDPKYITDKAPDFGIFSPVFPRNGGEFLDTSFEAITSRALQQFAPKQNLGSLATQPINRFKQAVVRRITKTLGKFIGFPSFF